MTINVYWSFLEKEWLRTYEPQEVRKILYQKKMHQDNDLMDYHRCPFVHGHLENVYALFSPYEYSFLVKKDFVNSKQYDQKFFNDHVIVRSLEHKAFSFSMPFVFFTDAKSLDMSFLYPHLEDNNVTERCMSFEGTFNIGKYFRNIDFAFFLKNKHDEFVIKENEIFGYVKFHTQERIKLHRFVPTNKIDQYLDYLKDARANKPVGFKSQNFFYNNFKIKSAILKEIKNNIADNVTEQKEIHDAEKE
jgi:hypothetical protein